MPASAYGIVNEQVGRIVNSDAGGLSAAFFFGLALAIWSANAGMKAIIDALNIALFLSCCPGLRGRWARVMIKPTGFLPTVAI